MRNPTNTCFLTTFNHQIWKAQKTIDNLDDTLRLEDDGPTSILEQKTTAAPDSRSQFLNYPQLHAKIRDIAQEKERHIYTIKMDNVLPKVAENALSDTFQTGFESANDGPKNKLLHFV